MAKEWTPPGWWYFKEKPPNDTAYFENLTHCIFQSGLNWKIIDNKWPNFIKAFHNFDIAKIASYDFDDIARLKEDVGIIRNTNKILATIHNAKVFQKIDSENGNFKEWLDSLDKANNYQNVIAKFKDEFKHVGDMTARIFLHSVGEPLEVDESLHHS